MAFAASACGSANVGSTFQAGGASQGGAGAAQSSAGAGHSGMAGTGGSSGAMNTGGAGATQGGASTGGSSGSSGAAGMPSTAKCSPTGSFGAPVPLESLNIPGADNAAARFMPDELTAFYDVDGDIYTAHRETLASPFTVQGPVEALAMLSPTESAPWISADGLTVLLEHDDSMILLAQRADLVAPFMLVSELDIDAAATSTSDPFVVGGANGRLYFSHNYDQLGAVELANWQPTTSPTLDGLQGLGLVRPVLTADELTLYFSTTDGAEMRRINRTQRANRDAAFGEPTVMNELGMEEGNYASWISADGCRLYLDAGAPGTRSIYVAEMLP